MVEEIIEFTKVTVNLPTADVEVLKRLAEKRRVSVTSILRQAIASENFLDEQVSAGKKFLVEEVGEDLDEDGKPNSIIREVIFKWEL